MVTRTASVNGSSSNGLCPNIISDEITSNCTTPASSVLFDQHIPTLTGLDGGMWASELLTYQTNFNSFFNPDIYCDFGNIPNFIRLERVEIVMFNCPQWGIGVPSVSVLHESGTLITSTPITITSCDSLVRVCLRAETTVPFVTLRFGSSPDTDWVHIAEVIFYDTGVCPADSIVISLPTLSPTLPTLPPTLPTLPPSLPTSPPATTPTPSRL